MDTRTDTRIAVVTGASAGIGAAIAEELSSSGITVIGLARRMEKLQEVASRCHGRFHPRVCDLQKEEEILSAFRWMEEKFGGTDILINNAAVAKLVPLIDGSSDQWGEMIKTNIDAINICTREALKTMRKRGDKGYIIHINSVAGHVVPAYPTMQFGIYSATKHAVSVLCEALRIELQAVKSKIKVSCISPGAVHTDMLSALLGNNERVIADQADDASPEDLFLAPKDVAEMVTVIINKRCNIQIHDIIIQPLGQRYS